MGAHLVWGNIKETTPYVLVKSKGKYSTYRLAVVKTNGVTKPTMISNRQCIIMQSWVLPPPTKTGKGRFHEIRKVAELQASHLNLCYQLKLGLIPLTTEMMANEPDPERRLELMKACLLREKDPPT